MIAITFALPAESSSFRRLLQARTDHKLNGVRTIRGTIDNRAIEVLHTGVGEKACRQSLERFLQDRQFDYLISTGFAGAITDQAHAGDLMLAKNFSIAHLDVARSALSNFRVQFGDLHTSKTMIDSIEERKAIGQTTGAVAVDMETEFIAQACAERGLPMISLRAISDAPNEPFPAPSDVLFDIASQRTNMMKLAAFFLTHPHRIPRLIQFARKISEARETLGRALVDLVRSARL